MADHLKCISGCIAMAITLVAAGRSARVIRVGVDFICRFYGEEIANTAPGSDRLDASG
jgi:hypothetical protein